MGAFLLSVNAFVIGEKTWVLDVTAVRPDNHIIFEHDIAIDIAIKTDIAVVTDASVGMQANDGPRRNADIPPAKPEPFGPQHVVIRGIGGMAAVNITVEIHPHNHPLT